MGPDFIDSSQRSPAGDLSLNISGPSIDRGSTKADLTQGFEIEAKFFLPRALAKKITGAMPFTQIEQRYFKRNFVRPLLERFLGETNGSSTDRDLAINREIPLIERSDFSIARIRRTRYPGKQPTYFIEFKGAKTGDKGTRISRREISLPISAKHYKALKEEATAGTIRKRRYAVSGTITIAGVAIPAVAQIDSLQAAGKKLHKVTTKFDTIDIELGDPSHIHALRAGHHSFRFLSSCIELSSYNEKLGKPLTTRRIAKNGLQQDGLKAIKKLEEHADRLRVRDKN